jgi:hypothetical protein
MIGYGPQGWLGQIPVLLLYVLKYFNELIGSTAAAFQD